jgi:rhodanese-related sulfurtransferase
MCADGGALSDAALQQLEDAAYTGAVRLEGGYAGWSEVGTLLAAYRRADHCY